MMISKSSIELQLECPVECIVSKVDTWAKKGAGHPMGGKKCGVRDLVYTGYE